MWIFRHGTTQYSDKVTEHVLKALPFFASWPLTEKIGSPEQDSASAVLAVVRGICSSLMQPSLSSFRKGGMWEARGA